MQVKGPQLDQWPTRGHTLLYGNLTSDQVSRANIPERLHIFAATATELLQERIEALRYAPPWSNVTTSYGITSVVASPAAIAPNFPNVTETYTVSAYPTGSTLTVVRQPNGTFTNNGVDLSASPCVMITVQATWTGANNARRTRQLSTIMSKGGL